MTIDEAIAQEKELEKAYRDMAQHCLTENRFQKADECVMNAEEHEQLAEWLEDYKQIKQWESDIIDSFCKYDASSFEELVANIRNKAIDDFKNKWDSRVKDLISWCEDCRLIGLQQADSIFDEIAEQLKAGGENDD